jgi:hypothetical protein
MKKSKFYSVGKGQSLEQLNAYELSLSDLFVYLDSFRESTKNEPGKVKSTGSKIKQARH